MGIRMQRNTWRTPLQLIDSWLPQPSMSTGRSALTSAAKRFTRAGWLGRNTSPDHTPQSARRMPLPHPTHQVKTSVVHSLHGLHSHASSNTDTRVVLSGRIADVCAELERLAALEPRPSPARH